MRLIGFIGPKGAGKDEAARILGEHSKIYGKLSFAGPLKKICQQLTGLHANFFNDPILKEKELKEPVVLTSRFLRSIKKELPLWVPEIQDNKRLYNADTMSITGLENQVMKTPRQLLQIVGTEFIRDRAFVDWHVNAAFGEKAMSELKGTAYEIGRAHV